MREITLFVMAYVTWLLLVFPYDPARGKAGPWDVQGMLLGLGVALVGTLLFRNIFTRNAARWWNPVRWFWGLVYLPVLAWCCIKANLQVAWLVLHPQMPIRPGIVKVKTKLKTETARTALANSITLTPGTLTVDVNPEKGELFIHWLAVEAEGTEEATERIVKRFEGLLKKVFE